MASLGGVPLIDFTPLSQLRDVYNQAQREKTRERTLADLATRANDPNAIGQAAMALLAAGDTQGGALLAQLGDTRALRDYNIKKDERDFGAQRQDRVFQQGITTRQVGLAERQAQEKPQYMQVEGPGGQKELVRIDPLGGPVRAVKPEGMETTPTNPFVDGKMTESQATAALYARRMFGAEKILREVENVGTDIVEQGKSKIPVLGNYLVSQDFQKLEQAQRDFINATLRRESGAVISPAEFENARKQYFPQPGDSTDTTQQKRLNRAEAIRGIAAAGGPGYRPPFTFNPEGGLVENKTPQPGQRPTAGTPAAKPTPQQAITEAQAAIQRGADPMKVRQRLIEFGIPESAIPVP